MKDGRLKLSDKRQTLHVTHALGNMLIITAIIMVFVSTAFSFSKGMDFEQAYAEILGNNLGATILAAMFFVGSSLPLGDTTKDRQTKLRSLTNRSLVSMFIVNLLLIPALGILPNIRIFLILDIVLMIMALSASALQMTTMVKRHIATALLEVLGSLFIVFAAAIQMVMTDMLPKQIQESSWISSLFAILVGIILLFISRKMQESESKKPK